MSKAKVLLLDIENSPAIVYSYNLIKPIIPHKQLIEEPQILSYAAFWLDNPDEVFYEENRNNNDSGLVHSLLKLLDEADVVVAHFGDGHDIPFILGRAFVHGYKPPSPFHTVDTCKIARKKFKLTSNSLAALCKMLGVTQKDDHSEFVGFSLWKEVMAGNPKAWEVNKRYNIGDIITLRDLYLCMLPWISNHPNVGRMEGEEVCQCPSCGSEHIQKRGTYITKTGLAYQRFQCQECFSWSKAKRAEKDFGQNVLRSV